MFAKVNYLTAAAMLLTASMLCLSAPAGAESFIPTRPEPPRPVLPTLPPPDTYTPPPPPPRITMPPPAVRGDANPFTAPLATDLTHGLTPDVGGAEEGNALAGIMGLPDSAFPSQDDRRNDRSYLLVRGDENSKFRRDSAYSATVVQGTVLVSMRRPTRLGFVRFNFGTLALTGDADIMITSNEHQTRIINLSGRGQSVKVKLSANQFNGQGGNVIALAPGYEVVAADHTLSRSEIRLADGFARRNCQSLEHGNLAVCEISTESVLTQSALVAAINSSGSNQDHRALNDMCKMAAVLNYVNGSQGFTQDGTQVAHR